MRSAKKGVAQSSVTALLQTSCKLNVPAKEHRSTRAPKKNLRKVCTPQVQSLGNYPGSVHPHCLPEDKRTDGRSGESDWNGREETRV